MTKRKRPGLFARYKAGFADLRGWHFIAHLFVPHLLLLELAALVIGYLFLGLGYFIGSGYRSVDGYGYNNRDGWIGEAIWIALLIMLCAGGQRKDGNRKGPKK